MTQQNQLPDPSTAYDTLFQGIQADVFFSKIASLRPEYYPQNDAQANYLLTLAGRLREVEQNPTLKQAEDAQHPFAQALQFLDSRLEQHGMGKRAAEQKSAFKDAAAAYAQDPNFYNSVISLKAAEAAQALEQIKALQAQRAA